MRLIKSIWVGKRGVWKEGIACIWVMTLHWNFCWNTFFVLCNVSISPCSPDYWFSFETVYIKPLQVYAHNTSSTSLAVSWDEPGELSQGTFCGVEILYRLNDSSQKFGVRVASRIPGYELIDLMKYTLYAISVKPFTLEGEGKESDEVLVRTGEDCEYW